MHIIFLEADKLGLILPVFERTLANNTKRGRRQNLTTFIKTMKGLGLLQAGNEVHSISLGVQLDGTRGLFILSKEIPTTQIIGQTGPEKGE